MKQVKDLHTGQFFIFSSAKQPRIYECTGMDENGMQYKKYGGTFTDIKEIMSHESGFNVEVNILSIDKHEKRGDYQIQSSPGGWRRVVGQILRNITSEQATTIGYALAITYGNESRVANITGYDNAGEKNAAGESLGNGVYCHCSNAYAYLHS